MIYTISNGILTARIIDLGAELTSVTDNTGKEYIFQPSPIWPGQAKNLFPNVGLAKNNYAIIKGEKYPMYQHGFAKTMTFKVTEQSNDSIEFSLDSCKCTKTFFPYDFTFKIKFTICGNQIKQLYTVVNKTDDDMYFGVACHTGFATTLESYVDFGDNKNLTEIIRENMEYLTGEEIDYKTEDGKLPVVPKYFGNGAHILNNFESKKLKLVNPELKTSVQIEFEDFKYITLWSTDDAATVLCLMPWCALPDYKKTNHIFEEKPGNVKLPAGEIFNAEQKFTFENLD